MAVETKAPERIWLQTGCDPEECVEPECPSRDYEGMTWCQHEVHDGDTGYVRADLHAALRARYKEAMEALQSAEYMISALRLAFDREDGRYRECVDAATKYRALIERHKEEAGGR